MINLVESVLLGRRLLWLDKKLIFLVTVSPSTWNFAVPGLLPLFGDIPLLVT